MNVTICDVKRTSGESVANRAPNDCLNRSVCTVQALSPNDYGQSFYSLLCRDSLKNRRKTSARIPGCPSHSRRTCVQEQSRVARRKSSKNMISESFFPVDNLFKPCSNSVDLRPAFLSDFPSLCWGLLSFTTFNNTSPTDC